MVLAQRIPADAVKLREEGWEVGKRQADPAPDGHSRFLNELMSAPVESYLSIACLPQSALDLCCKP